MHVIIKNALFYDAADQLFICNLLVTLPIQGTYISFAEPRGYLDTPCLPFRDLQCLSEDNVCHKGICVCDTKKSFRRGRMCGMSESDDYSRIE